jgi:zinc protease
MLRRGAAGLDARRIEDTLDRLGSEMAVDTSASSVAIHGQVIKRNLDAFCTLLGTLLGEPTFPEDELGRLIRETAAEAIDLRDNDRALAEKAFRRLAFAEHPYSKSGGGYPSTLSNIHLDDVRGFHAKHLVPGNVVFGFAGDITVERARELAARLEAALPAGAPPNHEIAEPRPIHGRTLVFIDKPKRTQTQIILGGAGTWPHDEDHVPFNVAVGVLGGTFTSRMMREIRSKRGWSYGASARASIERARHAFTMSAFPAATDAAPCVKLELGMLDAFVSEGVTAREVSAVKSYLIKSHAFEVDTASKRLHQRLDEELLHLPRGYYGRYTEQVKAVTAPLASEAVRTRIHPARLIVAMVGTASELLEKVQESIPGLDRTVVVPFDEVDTAALTPAASGSQAAERT